MKLRRYFAVLATAALTAFAAGSCAEPEDEFLHTDSRLLSIEVQPAGGGAARSTPSPASWYAPRWNTTPSSPPR